METDCLVEVFARLGLEDITLVVPFVCKSWRDASRNPLCWRKLDFRRLDILPWSNFSKSFVLCYSLPFFSFTYLLKFTINRSWNSVTEIRFPLKFTSLEDLIIASKGCKYLKSVALPILSQCDEPQIPQLVCMWKNLERLELESKPSSFKELVKNISLNCIKFSCFRISKSSFGEEDFSAIIRYLPKLKKFELIDSYVPKKDLIIVINDCKELESLKAIDCLGFNSDDEEINSRASHIKDFKMEDVNSIMSMIVSLKIIETSSVMIISSSGRLKFNSPNLWGIKNFLSLKCQFLRSKCESSFVCKKHIQIRCNNYLPVVDDLTVKDTRMIQIAKDSLKRKYEIYDLGLLH